MSFFIRGKEAIHDRIAFELRYRFGYAYLDKCGRILNTLFRDYPEWVLRGEQVSPQNAPLVSLRNSCLLNFSSDRIALTLERAKEQPLSPEEVAQFLEQVDTVSALVTEQLGITEFIRIGCRSWYIFAADNVGASEKWLSELGLYQLSKQAISAFGEHVEASDLTLILVGDDRKYRINLSGIERQALVDTGEGLLTVRARTLHEKQREFLMEQQRLKKRVRQNPQFASAIDVDAFLENSLLVKPRDFVETSIEQIITRLQNALR